MEGARVCLTLAALLSCARSAVQEPAAVAATIEGVEEASVAGALGQPLTVRCRAQGSPPPAVYWYRGSGMVPFSSAQYEVRGQELRIRRLSAETLGQYECQAYNGVGAPASWRVAVRAGSPNPAAPSTTLEPDFGTMPYNVPVQTSLPAAVSLAPGAPLSLSCEVDGYPAPEVRWSKNNVPLPLSSRVWISESRLTIERTVERDSGVYACHAANAYSSHSSATRVALRKVTVPADCEDNPTFANCDLIIRSRFCEHKYYSKFCCKSCVEAGLLNPNYMPS